MPACSSKQNTPRLARIARRDLDHAPLVALVAEKYATGAAELPELPGRVEMFEHGNEPTVVMPRALHSVTQVTLL